MIRRGNRTANVRSAARERNVNTVAVFGAGVAGLTAAHELAERGFKVTVFETEADERPASIFPGGQKPKVKLGGMAASQWATSQNDSDDNPFVIRQFPGAVLPQGVLPQFLPGEHGFRFFPAYYLHIWDQMQRTPIYEATEDGDKTVFRTTHQTVYDNVERIIAFGVTTPTGKPNLIFSRERPRSMGEMVTTLMQLDTLGLTAGDLYSFSWRLARYMATSPRRRRSELEKISAYDYFVDLDPVTGQPRIQYSPAFDRQLREMPKILAAFDAIWGDARTNIDTYLQLQLRTDRTDNKANGVLNGPTSEAWFDHWYRHLETMGVDFEQEQLHDLAWDASEKRIVARVKGRFTPRKVDAEYVVVATDAYTAERVSEPLRSQNQDFGGTIAQLAGFATSRPVDQPPKKLPNDPGSPHTETPGERDPYRVSQVGMRQWDRFQTLSGIQFYFDIEFQLVRGHVYFTDTPWGLSSINQSGLWHDQPFTFHQGPENQGMVRTGFSTVLSVDIGDWLQPAPGGPTYKPEDLAPLKEIWNVDFKLGDPKPAIHCTPDEIAAEVWRQMITSLANAEAVPPDALFPKPVWYTIDRNLVFDEVGYIEGNKTPYLVPIVNDWQNRPGGPPWNPHGSSPSFRLRDRSVLEQQNYWEAAHGGYQIHGDTVVFAGTWTDTFTRMTSMEAACESGRHAVNAILDHYIYSQTGGADPREDVGLDWSIPFGFLDQGGSSPVRQPSVAGDYCFIYDLENREPAEFRQTRLLDGKLAERGLPHPWESSGLDLLARGMNVPIGELLRGADVSRLIDDMKQWRSLFESLLGEAQPDEPSEDAADSGIPVQGSLVADREEVDGAPGSSFMELGDVPTLPKPLGDGPLPPRFTY